MSLTNFWTFITGLLAIGATLDAISTNNWKSIVAKALTNLNRRTFTQFVAGNSLDVFEKIFSKVFFSWSFFFRSGLVTIVFSTIGLWFLFHFFPHTFYSATSYFRSYLNSSTAYLAAGIPIIFFVVFVFICTGQTKYFLEIMKSSGGLSKFLMIGYADLVVTCSIGILSISLSVLIFIFFSLGNLNNNSKIIFNFTQPYDFHGLNTDLVKSYEEKGYFMHVVSYQIPITNLGRQLNDKEKLLVQKYPVGPDGITFRNSDPEPGGTFLIHQINRKGIVQTFYSDQERDKKILLYYKKIPQDLESACKLFANAVNNKRFRIQILDGWDTELIFNACKNQRTIELQLDFRVGPNAINYRKVLAGILGQLVSLVTESLLMGFNSYLYHGPIDIIRENRSWSLDYGNWLLGENLNTEAHLEYILLTQWGLLNGDKRLLERGGYPWSTFFVVTLFTSMFIWLVIITCVLLYPAILLLEKLAGEKQRVKIEKFPFTTVFLIFSTYLLIYEIFV